MKKLLVVGISALLAAPLGAMTLQLDYTYAGSFFATNPQAVTALEKAAADLSAVLAPTTLPAVTTDIFTGTGNPSTTATTAWDLQITHPSAAGSVTLPTFATPANVFRIYVGARALSGSVLGIGGPAGAGFGAEVNGFPAGLAAAVTDLEAAANAGLRGTSGPVMSRFSGSFTLGAVTAPYTFTVGAIAGALAMDAGADWHFDLHSLPPAGKSDFYSVALHEMLHALGIGASRSWETLASGTNWLGPTVIALTNGGLGVLTADQDHIAEGLMSRSLQTGLLQEAAMDPTITVGTRKTLTELDVAFLQDLGYATVPEPAAAVLALVGLVLALGVRPLCARGGRR